MANYFGDDIAEVFDELSGNEIYPIVYAYINGAERFSFIPEKSTAGMQKFIQSRDGDKRINIVNKPMELTKGDIFYVTCIDTPEKLEPIYIKYRDRYHAVYQRDIYTGEQ